MTGPGGRESDRRIDRHRQLAGPGVKIQGIAVSGAHQRHRCKCGVGEAKPSQDYHLLERLSFLDFPAEGLVCSVSVFGAVQLMDVQTPLNHGIG